MTGIVRSEAGRPLDGATVILDPADLAPRVTTNAAGQFRFTNVSPGPHLLRVLRVGFAAVDQRVDVPPEGLEVTIALQRVTPLDTVPIRARRTGVFGHVLVAENLRPLEGAQVDVVGGAASTRTPATGYFDFPRVREGAYLVNVSRREFETRLLSVYVPHDSAVELAVALTRSARSAASNRLAFALSDFAMRVRSRGRGATVIPRQEFAGRFDVLLGDALRFSPSFAKTNLILDDEACVFIDGAPRPGMTVNEITAGEVEAVEIYGIGQDYTRTLVDRWPPGQPCGTNPVAMPPQSSRKTGLQPGAVSSFRTKADPHVRAVVIWLKR